MTSPDQLSVVPRVLVFLTLAHGDSLRIPCVAMVLTLGLPRCLSLAKCPRRTGSGWNLTMTWRPGKKVSMVINHDKPA